MTAVTSDSGKQNICPNAALGKKRKFSLKWENFDKETENWEFFWLLQNKKNDVTRSTRGSLILPLNIEQHQPLELRFAVIYVSKDQSNFGHQEKSTQKDKTPAGFCVFLSDPDPESKICEKPDPDPESLFNFGSSRSLCDHFLSKNMGKLRLDRRL